MIAIWLISGLSTLRKKGESTEVSANQFFKTRLLGLGCREHSHFQGGREDRSQSQNFRIMLDSSTLTQLIKVSHRFCANLMTRIKGTQPLMVRNSEFYCSPIDDDMVEKLWADVVSVHAIDINDYCIQLTNDFCFVVQRSTAEEIVEEHFESVGWRENAQLLGSGLCSPSLQADAALRHG